MQTYKKVLLLILLINLSLFNASCQRNIFSILRSGEIDQYSASAQFKPYHISKSQTPKKKKLSRIERRANRKAERAKRQALKDQEKGRKEHIKKQTPEVQERMKKSREESERTRRPKTIWDRLKSWIRNKTKEKKL